MVVGTDGSDHIHRQIIATHYSQRYVDLMINCGVERKSMNYGGDSELFTLLITVWLINQG